MEGSGVSMKLLIDTQKERVLFAEAGKDCIDFLFQILCLPMATVVRLLNKQGLKGSLTNLYESVGQLSESYIQQYQEKDFLLNPSIPAPYETSENPLEYSTNRMQLYHFYPFCSSCRHVSFDKCTICRKCQGSFIMETSYATIPAMITENGFVKRSAKYMVMDDLYVAPILSTLSVFDMLKKFDVKNLGLLELKVVKLGKDEAVKLLRACLQSEKVLTEVFLGS